MGTQPPFLWVLGMVSCLSYGLVLVPGQFQDDRGLIWRQVVGSTLLAMAVGAGTAAAMALAVLPSLAAHELRDKLAAAVGGIGQAASRYASLAFRPEDPSQAYYRAQPAGKPAPQAAALPALAAEAGAGACAAPEEGSSEAVVDGEGAAELLLEDGETLTDEEFLRMITESSAPAPLPAGVRPGAPPPEPSARPSPAVRAALLPGGPPPVAALRPLLARARMCLGPAGLEPPFLQGAAFSPPAAAASAGGGRDGCGPASPPPSWAGRNLTWALQLVPVGLGLPLLGNLVHTLKAELPPLRTAEGRRALLRSRVFQSGVKYWAALATVLLLILGLAERPDTPEVRQWRPVFGYVAAALAMSERVSLVKDTVLWSRGILATPPIVPAVLRASLTLTDRLAALGLAASCPPSVGGSFSGWAFEHVTAPLHADTMALFAALDDMAAATANRLVLMAGGTAAAAKACAAVGPAAATAAAARGACGSAEAISAAVAELNQHRLRLFYAPLPCQIRHRITALRRSFHAAVMTAREADLPHLTAPDDALRVFSFVFALIQAPQVADKATALARTVAAGPDPGRRSWLGGSMWEWCK
ncbi:hypothetical protein GPECTOR_15g307 [Gonium pectorale]|uniref:Uncharacterized protein n=1 Tax=Gonium pectorale TaxID=33097 RepID=A0A150GLE6_GONPE|nr:hypothetical protein GPECTOR_15g307 [Gonium pectorale]|eukprot:KXZ50624.1 hypothetical protein GPECTOR_15g307 [Gonium pectorale]